MERVILVGIERRGTPPPADSLAELERLAETAGGGVVAVFVQKVDRPHPATLIGSGKVEEVAAEARRSGARAVIFDDDLSPAQQRNLEAEIPAKILDRTRLILDIFAQRARTREGELQVEHAQLSYLLPRLTGKGTQMMQQTGGIGTRGPGERALEYERRRIRDRIARLGRDIDRIRSERELQRSRRQSVPFPQIAIIGYTNVGKSTLLNALAESRAPVYADDRLFATLDPTTRRVRLPHGGWSLWTDTVGFIQKLPTALVASFRATLEEAARADCLVHLADASHASRSRQIDAVRAVLKELGAEEVPEILAYNKIDALGKGDELEEGGAIRLSARTGRGVRELLDRVEEVLSRRWLRRELVLPHRLSAFVAEAHRSSQVLSTSHREDGIHLRLRVTPENWRRLQEKLKKGRAGAGPPGGA